MNFTTINNQKKHSPVLPLDMCLERGLRSFGSSWLRLFGGSWGWGMVLFLVNHGGRGGILSKGEALPLWSGELDLKHHKILHTCHEYFIIGSHTYFLHTKISEFLWFKLRTGLSFRLQIRPYSYDKISTLVKTCKCK